MRVSSLIGGLLSSPSLRCSGVEGAGRGGGGEKERGGVWWCGFFLGVGRCLSFCTEI